MYVLEKADDQKFELNAGSRPYLIQIFDHRPSQVRKSPKEHHKGSGNAQKIPQKSPKKLATDFYAFELPPCGTPKSGHVV